MENLDLAKSLRILSTHAPSNVSSTNSTKGVLMEERYFLKNGGHGTFSPKEMSSKSSLKNRRHHIEKDGNAVLGKKKNYMYFFTGYIFMVDIFTLFRDTHFFSIFFIK